MRTRTLIRWAVASLLALAAAFLAWPALACGCGVILPHEGDASVAEERALIRWDGGTEDIVMELDVHASSTEAAWILPVPAPATVRLGDAQLFDVLQELTKPRIETRYTLLPQGQIFGLGGAAPGASAVTVLGRQTLGPFDVSSLAATDSQALTDWLAANGYAFPEGLADVLQPYVEQGWYYVAVRLRPGTGGQTLTGRLDPLWTTFKSDQIVYPMRATALAQNSQSVYVYVLADHRVEKQAAFGPSRVSFADLVEPASLEPGSPLAPFVPRTMFLTKFEDQIYSPAQVNDDFTFSFAAADKTYRDVQIEYVDEFAGIPFLVWLCCALPLALTVLVGLLFGGRWALKRRLPLN